MLRAQYERRGPVPQDVIEAVEFEVPRLEVGQALVEVVAAPINPADALTLTGEYGQLPPLPAIGGREGGGQVGGLRPVAACRHLTTAGRGQSAFGPLHGQDLLALSGGGRGNTRMPYGVSTRAYRRTRSSPAAARGARGRAPARTRREGSRSRAGPQRRPCAQPPVMTGSQTSPVAGSEPSMLLGHGVAQARRSRHRAPGVDESHKRAAVVGALMLGHQSSHQQANQLTAAVGVEEQSAAANARVLRPGR
jgi:hypothetical protein